MIESVWSNVCIWPSSNVTSVIEETCNSLLPANVHCPIYVGLFERTQSICYYGLTRMSTFLNVEYINIIIILILIIIIIIIMI